MDILSGPPSLQLSREHGLTRWLQPWHQRTQLTELQENSHSMWPRNLSLPTCYHSADMNKHSKQSKIHSSDQEPLS